MEISSLQQIAIILGIIGTAGATIYGIKKKRELTRSKLKTDKVRRSAYRSKKKAEEMRKAESASKIIKNFLDWFSRKWILLTPKTAQSPLLNNISRMLGVWVPRKEVIMIQKYAVLNVFHT